jgi:outer membrane biogenesis lipoprotein LolB
VSRARRLSVLLLLSLAACRGPVQVPLSADDPRPRALLEAWSARAEARAALRGQAWLAVDSEARGTAAPLRLRSRQSLVLERPGRVRIEVQGMLGTTLAVLAIDDGEYALFETETRRFEAGPLTPDLLWRITGLALRPDEVVEVVLGAPRVSPPLALRSAFSVPDGGVRVELADEAGPLRWLRFDAQDRLRELEVRETDGASWTARFDDYAPVAGDTLAHRISIETRSARAVLRLRDVELNPALATDIFRLDGPLPGSAAEGG